MIFDSIMINGEIIFKVNDGVLSSVNDTNETICLNSPTARCLQLLLERNHHVISRDDFMENVWGAKGIVVSQNTFYQNISLLRKSLKSAGLTEDIIVTVRGKGFMLSSTAVIVPMDKVEDNVCSLSFGDAKNRTTTIDNVVITERSNNSVILKESTLQMLKIPFLVKALLAAFVVLELLSLYHRYFG